MAVLQYANADAGAEGVAQLVLEAASAAIKVRLDARCLVARAGRAASDRRWQRAADLSRRTAGFPGGLECRDVGALCHPLSPCMVYRWLSPALWGAEHFGCFSCGQLGCREARPPFVVGACAFVCGVDCRSAAGKR